MGIKSLNESTKKGDMPEEGYMPVEQPPLIEPTSNMNYQRRELSNQCLPVRSGTLIWMRCVFTFTIFAYSLSGMILAILAYKQLKANTVTIEDFLHNWNQSPIEELVFSFDKCEEGWDNLINRKWPGTMQGCDCRESTDWSYRGIMYDSGCDSNQTDAWCDDIYSTPARSL